MNKHLIIFILFLINMNCYSQDLIKKTVTQKNGLKEIFFVLKNDKSTKHGEYLLLSGDNIVQKGFYTNGKKSGNWEYLSGNNTEFIYNYDSNVVVSDEIGKDRNAIYSEGFFYFQYLLYSNIEYPDEAKEAGIQGKNVIEFTIDIDGTPKDFNLKVGCGSFILNEEAMRVVKKTALENPWYPAINSNGGKVKSVIEREVNFIIR